MRSGTWDAATAETRSSCPYLRRLDMPCSDKILCARAWGQKPGGLVSPLGGWGGQGSLSSCSRILEKGPTMAKYTQREVDPQRYAQSRRRFLRNAGIRAVSLPFLGSLADPA